MEKKAHPKSTGNTGRQSAARRARTLADFTDPRVSAKRPAYRDADDARDARDARDQANGYHDFGDPGDYGDYFEPEYSARDEQRYSGPSRFTLPSHPAMPAMPAMPQEDERPTHRAGQKFIDRVGHPHRQQSSWDEHARSGDEWYGEDERSTSGRRRAQSKARPLTLTIVEEQDAPAQYPVNDRVNDRVNERSNDRALMTMDSVPDLVAWRPPMPSRRKPVYTRAIETARRNPWTVSRSMLALIAVAVTLLLSITTAGEPSQPLMQFFNVQAAGASAQHIGDLVQPLTQGVRKDQYDSLDQYNTYWGAACSAAVLAETLTAWGVKGVTIGRMIDELGAYISPYGGLLSYAGFQKVASLHGMRADFRENLTYKQMLYITNTMHLPLIVNVRISYGFYHFFSGGHFLVMTAGDSQGVRLVDSSLYYVHYMPLSVFNGMFTGRTELLTTQDYVLNLPPA